MTGFKDYYAILEIPFDADSKSIRRNYIRLCKKWHPDINTSDTTEKMQEIIEANLILSDKEARAKYDVVYRIYYQDNSTRSNSFSNKEPYDHEDPELRSWIRNAQKQSIRITEELIRETKNHFKTGLKAAINEMLPFKIW